MKYLIMCSLIVIQLQGSAVKLQTKEQINYDKNLILYLRAYKNGNYQQVINYMEPGIFKHYKNRKRMLKWYQFYFRKQSSGSFKITRYTRGKILGVYQCKTHKLVYTSTFMVIEYSHQRFTSSGFVVAARKNGASNWHFVDGGDLQKRDIVNVLFSCQGIQINTPKITDLKYPRK